MTIPLSKPNENTYCTSCFEYVQEKTTSSQNGYLPRTIAHVYLCLYFQNVVDNNCIDTGCNKVARQIERTIWKWNKHLNGLCINTAYEKNALASKRHPRLSWDTILIPLLTHQIGGLSYLPFHLTSDENQWRTIDKSWKIRSAMSEENLHYFQSAMSEVESHSKMYRFGAQCLRKLQWYLELMF